MLLSLTLRAGTVDHFPFWLTSIVSLVIDDPQGLNLSGASDRVLSCVMRVSWVPFGAFLFYKPWKLILDLFLVDLFLLDLFLADAQSKASVERRVWFDSAHGFLFTWITRTLPSVSLIFFRCELMTMDLHYAGFGPGASEWKTGLFCYLSCIRENS